MKLLTKVFISLVIFLVSSLVINCFTKIAYADQPLVWQPVNASMLIQHGFPESILLPNNNVLVINGQLSGGNESAEIFEPLTESWKLTDSLAKGMFINSAVSLKNGKVLVSGTGLNKDFSQEVTSEIYNSTNDSWALTSNMIINRYLHKSILLEDGRVLAAGGTSLSSRLGISSSEIFDPTTNQWTLGAPMNIVRYGHTISKLSDGRVLVTGGQNNTNTYLKSSEIYDPNSNTWALIDDMSLPRFGHTATVLPNGKILVAGGISINDPTNSSEIYDPTSNKWSPTGSMNVARFLHTATLLKNGTVLVTGGIIANQGSFSCTNTTELYDPSTGEWTFGPILNSPRCYHTAVKLSDDTVLVAGGKNDVGNILNAITTAEILKPGTSSAPTPFLDLPWDYEGKGMGFSKAALLINSYFDHQYPFLGSGLGEPSEGLGTIINYLGPPKSTEAYSSHDGYDYGLPANVRDGDPVYPAAPGIARYVYDNAGGNAIYIDHQNGYQTRYYHLQSVGLITKTPGAKIQVDRSTIIGKVGSTGNHTTGPHIHIGVFQDKNHDGNFDDNIPDGATDPFGWQSTAPDPWENYYFLQNGVQKTGNKSYYLWRNKIDGLKEGLTANGGVFKSADYSIEFPSDPSLDGLTLEMQSAPSAKLNNSTISMGTAMSVILKDPLGSLITVLTKPMLITISFLDADISKYKPGTISIYSSTDNEHWTKENSFVDYLNKRATANVNHLTYFALMGERIDTIAPTTTTQLSGSAGQTNWFRSDVQITLHAADNTGGLGIDNTQYKIDGEDWQPYSTPFNITTEGHHKIEYYSEDKDGNIEDVKSIEFDIDKTPPEAQIKFDLSRQELIVSGSDNSGQTKLLIKNLSKNVEQTIITDNAGNELILENQDNENGKRLGYTLSSLTYNGNVYVQNKNKLTVSYSEDSEHKIKAFEQKFEISDIVKIDLKFNPTNNTTTIIQDKQKTEETGIKILQLSTQNGTIKYSY